MNKTIITGVVIAVVFGGGGYYFGSQSASQSTAGQGQFAQGASGGFAGRSGAIGGRAGGFGGGATFGTVIDNSNGSITLQLAGGTSPSAETGTKIVLVNSSTQVEKMVTGSISDLAKGTAVSVTGTSNSDGSITATNIQIRPMRLQATTTQAQ